MENVLRIAGFAEIYERILVPSMFAPWADELIDRARPVGPSDRILDLGCGTGIVARKLRERLGGALPIIGVDASADMVAMAKKLAPEIDWQQANATELPFADGSFELVVCQQMLQFVPDTAAALREIRRVLVPGGRVVLATWRAREEQALFEVLGTIAEKHLGTPNETRFALGDEKRLCALLAEAGFTGVRAEIVGRNDHFREFPYRGSALAANFDLASLSPEEREARLVRVEAESIEAAKPFATSDGIRCPSRANLLMAIAK